MPLTATLPMTTAIRYDYPLNERIRLLLRLELLFSQFDYGAANDGIWHSRLALAALFELLELTSRAEPKSEISRELERQGRVFGALKNRPGIDDGALDRVLDRIERTAAELRATGPAVFETLQNHGFLTAVRQRNSIPGGSSPFDLPELHHWLQLTPPATRRDQLERWLQPLLPLRSGGQLVLELLRSSATPRRCLAAGGLYQQTFDNDPTPQLLRMEIAAEQAVFPEISGDRHRCAIRFMHQASPDEPIQPIGRDIEFQLACCAI